MQTVVLQQDCIHHSSFSPAWDLDQQRIIAEAIKEAMDTSQFTKSRSRSRPRPSIESPQDIPTPAAHLPLRKASAQRLQSRKGGVPRPLFAPSGIRPSPVQPLPYIDNVTASSEHAFAGRDPRRPFKPPLGVFQDQQYAAHSSTYAAQRSPSLQEAESRPPSSPLLPQPPSPHMLNGKSLRNSKSLGEGLRGGRTHAPYGASLKDTNGYDASQPLPSPSGLHGDGPRESYKSALTSNSSFGLTGSVNTRRSSLTGNSSHSDFVKLQQEDWQDATDIEMSVEDAIGMYEDGFDSAIKQSFDIQSVRSTTRPRNSLDVRSLNSDRPSSQPHSQQHTQKAPVSHRRSQSASMLLGIAKQNRPGASSPSTLAPPDRFLTSSRNSARTIAPPPTFSATASDPSKPVPRDRYGFKKASHYVTVEQYDAWDAGYSEHISRRSKKWHALMRSYGLATDPPFRFPPKSDKIKRYVRKGIPPEFRGAAWFWYAGGPSFLAKERGLYRNLIEKVNNGHLSDTDREHIERDLNRTFPDNITFKPDPAARPATSTSSMPGEQGGPINCENTIRKVNGLSNNDPEPETPIVQALRRVLQAFAVHNPNIGYCQSLNFIAGLLLLFLDADEEKAFVLLSIITSKHLPGTHGIALEGANVDIAVLMSCLKDSLPAVWTRLDDQGGSSNPAADLRLPTISLATTAWFMSLFVGTLPIEAVLRVWDCLFFEGSKTLFRVALAIFKTAELAILGVSDPMEIFQLVQTVPRGLLDVNTLLELCFRRRGSGFAGVSQGLIEGRREERRRLVKEGARQAANGSGGTDEDDCIEVEGRLRRFTRRVRSRTAK